MCENCGSENLDDHGICIDCGHGFPTEYWLNEPTEWDFVESSYGDENYH